jgi:hypothetical protein
MIPLPVSCLEHSRLNYRPRVASTTLGAVLLNYGETLKLIEAIAYSDPRVLSSGIKLVGRFGSLGSLIYYGRAYRPIILYFFVQKS